VVEIGSLTICLTYKSPNACDDLVTGIYTVIDSLATVDNLIVLGDFNCPDVDWLTMSASSACSSTLCDLLFKHTLAQLVSAPTHIHGGVLDLILKIPLTTYG
jgi:hypothetical protein